MNYGARFYDPAVARWWVQDSKAEKGYGWSPYRYGFDNPVNVTDPDGMLEDEFYKWTEEKNREFEEFNRQMDQSYSAMMTKQGYDMPMTPDDPPDGDKSENEPFIKIKVDTKIGLLYTEKLKIFGWGEEFNLNLASVSYMTFKWNSKDNKITYIPYSGATSGLSVGMWMFSGGVEKDWINKNISPFIELECFR